MESEKKVFGMATLTLIVGGVGVGMFGLPFVFAQAGAMVGVAHLIVIGIVNTIILVIFADLLAGTKEHSRISGVVERYLGREMGFVVTLLTLVAGWVALLAYVLVGGGFVHEIVGTAIGGGEVVYQTLFFVVASLLLLGGIRFIGRVEAFFAVAIMALIATIVIASGFHFDASNLMEINVVEWFSPFGVVLFALGGLAAVPEMADLLGKYRKDLKYSVILGSVITIVIYALFSLAIVSVSGAGTTEFAIEGLASKIGRWMLIAGGVTAFFATFTSYLLIGMSIIDSLVYDYKWRFLRAWVFTISIPFLAYLFGATDFIQVISLSGALLSGAIGLILILTYIKAKNDAWLPKRHFHYSNYPLYFCALILLTGIAVTLVDLI